MLNIICVGFFIVSNMMKHFTEQILCVGLNLLECSCRVQSYLTAFFPSVFHKLHEPNSRNKLIALFCLY